MRYVKLPEYYPHTGVDVYVVTDTGKPGIARYWADMDKWLTSDKNLTVNDNVVKWRYANATEAERKNNNLNSCQQVRR